MAPPSRQDDGGTRAATLTYVSAFAGVVVHAVVPVRKKGKKVKHAKKMKNGKTFSLSKKKQNMLKNRI